MSEQLPVADRLERNAAADDTIALSYNARLLRRKRLVSDSGCAFLVDFPEVQNVTQGDAFVLQDGMRIGVVAADEAVLRIAGDLTRLAWHIGNRHTPCQITPDHLIIQSNHVMADMLRGLGAILTETNQAFTPEGGAYGLGRTFGHSHHDHAHTDHDHD